MKPAFKRSLTILKSFLNVLNIKWVFIILIIIYQKLISPFLGSRCRFYPSCSEYSKQAFIKYGFLKGFYLMIRRVLKCNRFHPGGFDPLP